MTLTGCHDHSAVIVEGRQTEDRRRVSTIGFERVRFVNNGDLAATTLGGAVHAEACRGSSCGRSLVRFDSCHFQRNRAAHGGAVFARDIDLVFRKCAFKQNEAEFSGGAICVNDTHEASLEVVQSEFVDNTARGSHGLIGSTDGHTHSAAEWTAQTDGMGGAIFASCPGSTVLRASSFSGNSGCGGGGAFAFVHSHADDPGNDTHLFEIEDSTFDDNAAFCGGQPGALLTDAINRDSHFGGALMLEAIDAAPSAWSIRNASFFGNRACHGGAISLRSPSPSLSEHTIVSCIFDGNAALVSGGSLFLINAHLTFSSSIFRNGRSMYGGGLRVENSVLKSVLDTTDRAVDSVIENNTGIAGGGIFLSTGVLYLERLVLRNNTSYRAGGGIQADGDSTSVTLCGIRAEENRASTGGGVAFFGVRDVNVTSWEDQPSLFRNNTAAAGAGMLYEAGETSLLTCTVENSSFVGNRALHLIKAFRDEARGYVPFPPAGVDVPDVEERLGGDVGPVKFSARSSEGKGGGIGVSFAGLRPLAVVEMMFRNILVRENEAIVGGGVSVEMAELLWNENRGPSCFPIAIGFDVCRHFEFQNVTVTGNKATFAGGVFSSAPGGIVASCGGDDEKRTRITHLQSSTERGDQSPFCVTIVDNFITDDDTRLGADVGTRAVRLEIEEWDGPLVPVNSGENLRVPCKGNASCTHPPRILVKDALNTTITRGIEDARLKVVLVSDAIVGDNTYTAVNGVVEISDTRAWGINVTSNLTIASERDKSVSVDVPISTRDCNPGEIEQVDVCRLCPVDQYGFDASLEKCESCEEHAVCGGGAMLVPIDGYWHSTPFSPAFYKCIYPSACRYDGRQENLEAFYQDAALLKTHLDRMEEYTAGRGTRPEFPEYRQCSEGYAGPFCGSCQSGYGHSYTGECTACPERKGLGGFRVFLNVAWLFLLIGVNCAITLSSTKSRVTLAKHEQQGDALQCETQSNLYNGLVATSTSQEAASIWRSVDAEKLFGQDDASIASASIQLLVTTALLTETLKILINYLQVTAIALRLQTQWPGPMRVLLQTEGFFVGSLASLITAPFECSTEGDHIPASIAALWLRLFSPFTIVVFLILAFALVWLCLRIRSEMTGAASSLNLWFSRKRFVTMVIVVSIVSIHFSYIDIVRELLRSVNCVEKGEMQDEVRLDHPYLAYATEVAGKRVWAEDTELTCFEGSHLPVAIVGIAGLILAFCGMVSIVLWLPLNRKHMTDSLFLSRYWFLFQAYRREWYTVCWESVILARKSLIAAAVVFTIHLTPALKASLCAGILTVSLALQAIFVPFKTPPKCHYLPDYAGALFSAVRLPSVAPKWLHFNNAIHLNLIESASLLSSALVFYCAVASEDAASSSLGRVFMCLLAFSVNVVFVVYVTYRLYAGLHLFLDLKLQKGGSPFLTNHQKNTMGLGSLFLKLQALLSMWKGQLEGRLASGENQSPAMACASVTVMEQVTDESSD